MGRLKFIKLLFILLSIVVFIFISRDTIRRCFNISYRDFYNVKLSLNELSILEEGLKISNIDYNFNKTLEYGNNPVKIIYHHCARSIWPPEDINEFHKEKGWAGIGYHFYIRKNGDIYKGRDENAIGAHTIGYNNKSIGICVEGNFEENNLTKKQLDSLVNLSFYIILKYDINEIMGHKEAYETLCPGKNFNIKETKNLVIEKIKNYSNKK